MKGRNYHRQFQLPAELIAKVIAIEGPNYQAGPERRLLPAFGEPPAASWGCRRGGDPILEGTGLACVPEARMPDTSPCLLPPEGSPGLRAAPPDTAPDPDPDPDLHLCYTPSARSYDLSPPALGPGPSASPAPSVSTRHAQLCLAGLCPLRHPQASVWPQPLDPTGHLPAGPFLAPRPAQHTWPGPEEPSTQHVLERMKGRKRAHRGSTAFRPPPGTLRPPVHTPKVAVLGPSCTDTVSMVHHWRSGLGGACTDHGVRRQTSRA